MTRRTPASPRAPMAAFPPVAVRARYDGWTADRQADFITALAATANVEAAARCVGMGTSSAYELRARPDAAPFRRAWQIALDYGIHRLAEAALDRALNGTVTPVFYKGEQVGERRRHDERLAMFLLRMRDPERFGSWREGRMPVPDHDNPALRLSLATLELRAERAAPGAGIARLLADPPLLSKEDERLYGIVHAEATVRAARHDGTLPPDGQDDGDDPSEPDTGGGM
ncbi:hypothetical protein Q5H91_10715 [Sphingomonas sp. KR1UV-12]|uniref:Terminase small subunit n=1 Tax=Sphingomonas aurea TaxID=3063994 RepID=A0ABT9EL53_9SPHN|nr:hypothetical protein [Sphingomonas sp. KR1UV-12]MDP1027686.1 hypothetical protein [Sphingomonas sp. KR1UV-12]